MIGIFKYKKYIIFFLLIILISFSGCLDFIATREKQLCLDLTHFSSTTIEDCSSQSSCYKNVEGLNFYTSPHLPNELNSSLLRYKNQIASTYFYYSLTKKEVQQINSACKNNEIKTIISVKVSFFQNIRNVVRHIDKSIEESLYLLKGYASYLQAQDIDLIPEEDLFDNYIQLNENLNTLTTEEENETYASKLNDEIYKLYQEVEKLGYDQTYMSEQNMSDLYAYYANIYAEDLKETIEYIPTLQDFSLWTFNYISEIDDLDQINKDFKNLDVYNFYQIMNSFVGYKHSLLTNFITITNNYNENLDKVYKNIKETEETIENEKEFLTEKEYARFLKLKKEYDAKHLTFGYYLSELKKIKKQVLENKSSNLKEENERGLELLSCDLVIEQAKQYSSLYFKERIISYQKTENIIIKIKICQEIEEALNEASCKTKIENFLSSTDVEKEEFELFVFENDKQCKEVLGNINYKLESYQKIILIKKMILETSKKINEIEVYEKDYLDEKKIIEIKEFVEKLKKQDNIVLITGIDGKINAIIENNKQLDEISKNILNKQDVFSIAYETDKYFLKIENPFTFDLQDLSLEHSYQGLSSNHSKLSVQGNKLKITKLYTGDNYFEVFFTNKKEITYKILYLSLEESVVKLTIKNQIEGIQDSIDFVEGFKTSTSNVKIIKNKVFYETKLINEIILIGPLFEKKVSSKVTELTSTKFFVDESIKITNKYPLPIAQKIILKEIPIDAVVKVSEDGKEIETQVEEGKVISEISIASEKSKEYTLQIITPKEEVFSEVKKLVLEITKFKECVFLDIQSETNTKLKELLKIPYKDTYSVSEISLFFTHLAEIEGIRGRYAVDEKKEIDYHIKYQEIEKRTITDKERNSLVKIDSSKYKNIVNAEKEITLLLESIILREEKENQLAAKENHLIFQDLKDKITNYKLEGINIDLLSKEKDLKTISEIINQALKKKAEELYKSINPEYNNLSTKNITYLINKTYLLYEDYDLSELYAVNYFSGITRYDAERLEKNMNFIDGVAFNKELSNFEEKFDTQKYEDALNSISLETLNRVDKIKADVKNIENGIDIIKNDAKTEIIEYQKKTYNSEVLTLAKKEYESEKYLNSILLIRKNTVNGKTSIKGQQTIIFTMIIILFVAIYAYLKFGNKKKEESHKEKKKKILRH